MNAGADWNVSMYYHIFKALHNIKERDANSLSEHLHELGVILHFQKDLFLRYMIILKPEWCTDAVYKVFNSETLRKQRGILHENDLVDIWKEEDGYSHRDYPNLLRIMSNFEIAFRIQDTTCYVIPELLPQTADYIGSNWDSNSNLQFQYYYDDFFPTAIIPRFIVRIHRYIERDDKGNYLCWKWGAMLKKNNSYAYIKAFPMAISQKRIEIKISGGSNRNKREFLTIIRYELDSINIRFRNLSVTRRIPCRCSPNCSYRFDYDLLLKAEQEGVKKRQCGKNPKEHIDILKLLDGIERIDIQGIGDINPRYTINLLYGDIHNPKIEIKCRSKKNVHIDKHEDAVFFYLLAILHKDWTYSVSKQTVCSIYYGEQVAKEMNKQEINEKAHMKVSNVKRRLREKNLNPKKLIVSHRGLGWKLHTDVKLEGFASYNKRYPTTYDTPDPSSTDLYKNPENIF